jgi:hypothetical protein
MVAATAVDKRRDPIPDYTDAYEAALASGETTNAPARKSPPVLDLTGSSGKSQTSENQKGREASPESKRPIPVKATAHKVVKSHKVQRRPSERKPGRVTVRKAGEPPSIPKDDACVSLPGAVIWKNLRPDHRQAMLGASSTMTPWTASWMTAKFMVSSGSRSSSRCSSV